MLGVFGRAPHIEHVVAADEHFAEMTRLGAADKLVRVGELEVHVRVDRDEVALVLHAPLELDDDGLAREAGEEGLRVEDQARLRRSLG